MQILLHSSVRGHCIILYKSFVKDLVEILVRSSVLSKKSLHEELADAMSQRCLYESSCWRLWEVLVSRSSKIGSSSSRSFYADLVRFSRGPGMKILLTIFFASQCVKILWRFC